MVASTEVVVVAAVVAWRRRRSVRPDGEGRRKELTVEVELDATLDVKPSTPQSAHHP